MYRLSILIIIILSACIPLVVSGYTVNFLTQIFLFAFLASAWNLMALTGLVSLGHAAFFGIGGYATAWLYVTLSINPIWGAFTGSVFAMFLAFVVYWIAFRCGLKGIYFSGLTLVLAEGLRFLAINSPILGRSQGLEIVNLHLTNTVLYGVSLSLMIFLMIVTWVLLRSPLGYRLQAVRENEVAAEALGVSTFRVKLTATLLSAGFVAVGGSLHALLLRFVEPESDFGLSISLNLLLGTFLGGTGTVLGPPIGIAVLFGLRELIARLGELFSLGSSGIYALQQVLYGAVLMLVVYALPEGLVNRCRRFFEIRGFYQKGKNNENVNLTVEEFRKIQVHKFDGELLKVVGVSRTFSGISALTRVSFNMKQGEILGLIGPNGAGKTTLFNTISGIFPAQEGMLIYKGNQMQGLPPNEVCKLGIARTFQIVQPFAGLTVFENALVGALSKYSDMASARAAALNALSQVGLLPKQNNSAGSLTLQDRKMLEFARALATQPELILLDEVMAGLNPIEQENIGDKILEINKSGVSFLLVEHAMRAVMRLSNRIVVLNNGEVIAEGTPDQITANENVISVYLGSGIKSGDSAD